jgi:hypothetical protein
LVTRLARSEELFVCWSSVGVDGGLTGFAFITVGAIFALAFPITSTVAINAVVIAITNILHLAVSVGIGTPGAIAVTTIVVALAAVVLSRRAVTSAAWGCATTRRSGRTVTSRTTLRTFTTATTVAATLSTALALSAGVEAP